MITALRIPGLRIARYGFVSFCISCFATWPSNAHAQGCPPIVDTAASHTSDLFIRTVDGACTLDATDDGGYIKTNTSYKLHIAAAVTGKCQTRMYQYPPGGCVNSTLVVRTIGTSSLSVDAVLRGNVAVEPSNTSTIQNHDTRVPTNTLGTGISYTTSTLGAHVYTSSTNTIATSCSFSPTSFPQNQSITVNALSCEPKFLAGTKIPHLAPPTSPDKVQVFLNAAMSSAASALDAVIDSWNTNLSGTGVSAGESLDGVHRRPTLYNC